MRHSRRDQCAFIDSRDQVLRHKTVRLVRVLRRPPIPYCLGMKVRGLVV